MSSYNNFLKPSESHLVVGRRSHEKRFEEMLSSLKEGKLKENIVIISGSPGIGKTSLINVFEEIVLNEMLIFVECTVGIGEEMNREFFRNLYAALKPHLQEVKKGFLKRSKEVSVKSFKPSSKINELTTIFETNLNERPLKKPVVVSIDPIDRILDSGQKYIIDALEALIKTFQEKYPILFIIACQEYNLNEISGLIQIGEHFILDRLDFKDSRLLLSKISTGKLRSSSYLRDEIVKLSDRTPFNLSFCSDVINWIENRIKREGLSESEENIKDMASPFIKNFALRAFVKEVFQITEDEDEVLQLMLGQPRNVTSIEIFNSAKVLKPVIDDLEKKGLILKLGGFYQFVSYALFASLGAGFSAIDLKTEVGLLLQVLEGDIVMGFGINPKVLERLEQTSYQSEGFEDKSIPNRTKSLYQGAIERKNHFEAFRLALLTGSFLRMANDIEGSAMFFEEAAQAFYDNEKMPYTIALYRKSIEAYKFIRKERKRKDLSQRLAMLYQQLAERYEKQGQIMLARSNYYHSTILFEKADDFNSANVSANKAMKTYSSDEKRGTIFFENLLKIHKSKEVELPPEA
ncbi:MAG: ATP-binding protein [Candidatus Hodarchaeota archaeon]